MPDNFSSSVHPDRRPAATTAKLTDAYCLTAELVRAVRACFRAIWRATLRCPRIRVGGPRYVVAPHPVPTDATAARPSINTTWLRPYAALVPARNATIAQPISSNGAPAVASRLGGGSRGHLSAPIVCPPCYCCPILHTQIILSGGDCQGGWYSQKMVFVDSTVGAIVAQ